MQRILREQGPKFVQAVWQPGAAQPAPGPEDEAGDAQQLPPDEAARTLFGLLKSPEREADDDASEPGPPVASTEAGLSHDDARRLKAALQELGECRKLLDEALQDQAA